MSWTDRYVGIPFQCDGRTKEGCDCWGLVRLVYKDMLGVDLPLHLGVFVDQSMASLIRVARAMKVERLKWALVTKPAPYDVALIRSSVHVWHCGIIVDSRRFLHIESGVDAVVEEISKWRIRIEEFRRYVP